MLVSVQTVQALYTDLSQGNLSKILSVLDANTRIYKPGSLPHGGVYKGRDGFIALMTRINQTWERLQIIPGSVIASGETVVATGECIAKIRTAADAIHFPFVHLWKIPQGVVTEIWLYYWDTAHVLAYLNGLKG